MTAPVRSGTAVLVGRFEPESPEWYAARAVGVTGSEIAALLDLSPWESSWSLWHRKAGTIGPQPPSQSMDWGHRLEPVIRERWLEDRGGVWMGVDRGGTWAHTDRPWQVANPDLLVGHGIEARPAAVVEVKSADSHSADEWGPDGTDGVPVYYRAQGLWYADVFGVPSVHFAVLIGGNDYREYEVTPAPGELEFMRDRAQQFLARIASGRPPAIDGHPATYAAARQLHPDIDHDLKVEIPATLSGRYRAAVRAVDRAEARKRRHSSVLLTRMGRARRALDDTGAPLAMRQAAKPGATPYLKPVKPVKVKETA